MDALILGLFTGHEGFLAVAALVSFCMFLLSEAIGENKKIAANSVFKAVHNGLKLMAGYSIKYIKDRFPKG